MEAVDRGCHAAPWKFLLLLAAMAIGAARIHVEEQQHFEWRSTTATGRRKPKVVLLDDPETIHPAVIVNGKSYDVLVDSQGIVTTSAPPGVFPLPKPVLVVGMPKVGTTSIYQYFVQADHYRASHHKCNVKPLIFCGLCLRDTIRNGSTTPLRDVVILMSGPNWKPFFIKIGKAVIFPKLWTWTSCTTKIRMRP